MESARPDTQKAGGEVRYLWGFIVECCTIAFHIVSYYVRKALGRTGGL